MSKKIVRVMVFYDDGTFDEVKAEKQSTLTYPPGVRSPEFPQSEKPFTIPNNPWTIPPCAKCGSTNKINCTIPDCPTGWGNPWDNRNKVID
jgi:hypothetical protein